MTDAPSVISSLSMDDIGWSLLPKPTPAYMRPVNTDPLPDHIDSLLKLAGWLIGNRLNARMRMHSDRVSQRHIRRRIMTEAKARRLWREQNPPARFHLGDGS